jgi:dynein heavy chain
MVIKQSELLVNDYPIIPYRVITELTAEVNYGGRVTDKFDRILMANLLLDFCNVETVEVDYKFSPAGVYKSIATAGGEGTDPAVYKQVT